MRDMPSEECATRVTISFLELEANKTWRLQGSFKWPFLQWVEDKPVFASVRLVADLDYALYFEKKGLYHPTRKQVFELYPDFWGIVLDHETFDAVSEIAVVVDWHSFETSRADNKAHLEFISNMEAAGWENLSSGLLLG